MVEHSRLERAAALVTQLRKLSARSPRSWRRAHSVGRDIGLEGAELEQAMRDADKAGFILRRVDDEGLIILTDAGRAAAPHLPR